jgi:hypothetical protein
MSNDKPVLFIALTLGAALASSIATSTAQAADWQIRRGHSSGTCSIQSAQSLKPLGKLLAQKPKSKDACIAARSLGSKDAADTSRCIKYTPNTKRFCARRKVDLP